MAGCYAYEETRKLKVGRAQRETKVRKKIESKGALVALSNWATAEDVTPGFLSVMGRHGGVHRFDESVIQAARTRLEGFGVALPKTWRSRLT